jgi:hypothetical protein
MKTKIAGWMMLAAALIAAQSAQAQTVTSVAINSVLAAGTTGYTLPNGVVATAQIVSTGGGTYIGTSTGYNGNDPSANIGGVYNGQTLSGFQGNPSQDMLTAIQKKTDGTVEGGKNNMCKGSIGFWIHFTQPQLVDNLLMADIDGANNNPINAEWTSVFGYNGTDFIQYKGTVSASGTQLVKVSAFTNPNASWNTMISTKIAGAQAVQSPEIWRCNTLNGGTSDPGDTTNQVLFNPPANQMVTDLFVLWGLWQQPGVSSAQASAVGPIVIKTPASVSLSLTLGSFTASFAQQHTQLNWHTETEVQTSHFDVQYSTDAKVFTTIGTVNACGAGDHDYHFIHNDVPAGNAYYRLKMADQDGSFAYSKVVRVNRKSEGGEVVATVYPNPGQSFFKLQLPNEQPAQMQVTDVQGRLLLTAALPAMADATFDCAAWTPGIYFITVSVDGVRISTTHFVRQ